MSIMQDVMATSLLGTRRRQLNLNQDDSALGKAIGRLHPRTEAERILALVAILTIYRYAGTGTPGAGWNLPAVHPSENRVAASDEAIQRLKSMLEGKHQSALPEWLGLLEQSHGRLPEECLPTLLDLGLQSLWVQSNLNPELIGQRGQYLAKINPAWGYVLGDFEEKVWELGTKPQRLHYLKEVRKTDPHKARSMLESVWSAEPPEVRVELLNILEHKLSLADEVFLENVLDDRDERVRVAASGLLGKLIDSALVGRMSARLDPALSLQQVSSQRFGSPFSAPRPASVGEPLKPETPPNWNNGLRSALGEQGKASDEPNATQSPKPLGIPPRPPLETVAPGTTRSAVIVKLPEVLDSSMKRDGVRAAPTRIPSDRSGEKQQWVRSMVACVPPIYWRQKFNLSAEQLIDAAKAGNASTALIGGWQTAARNFHDEAMIEALLWTLINPSGTASIFGGYQIETRLLMGTLSPERRESFLSAAFTARGPLAYDRQGLIMLECCTHPWSRAFSAFIAKQLGASLALVNANQIWSRRRTPSGGSLTDTTWSWWGWFGLYMHPDTVEEYATILTPLATQVPPYGEVISMLIDLLRFRHDMRKELT